MDFMENYYGGYTNLPNAFIKLRSEGEITRTEFEVMHLIYSYRNFKAHKTSCKQIAKLIGGIKRHTVSDCLKSLSAKGFIRTFSAEFNFIKIEVLIKEITTLSKTKEVQFTIDSRDGLQSPPPWSPESTPLAPKDHPPWSPEATIELNSIEIKEELNKKEDNICRAEIPTHPASDNPLPSLSAIKKKEKTKQIEDIATRFCAKLNTVTGSSFKATSKVVLKLVSCLFKQGYTNVDDYLTVVNKKAAQWQGDAKMEQYLRPSTLLNGKFEEYLAEKEVNKNNANIKNKVVMTEKQRRQKEMQDELERLKKKREACEINADYKIN